MRKLWTDINTVLGRTAGELDCPLFRRTARHPMGIPVVVRARDGRVEVLEPELAETLDSPQGGRCRLVENESGGIDIYLFLPPGITREGLVHVFAREPIRGVLVRMSILAGHRGEADSEELASLCERELVAERESLEFHLHSLVPGTVYCREVASLAEHVTQALVGTAIAVTGSSDRALAWMRAELEAEHLLCDFDPEALRQHVGRILREMGLDGSCAGSGWTGLGGLWLPRAANADHGFPHPGSIS